MGTANRSRIAIAGASGFAGGELVRLLADRSDVEIAFLGAGGSAGSTLAGSHPHLAGLGDLAERVLEPIGSASIAERADLVFLALPNGSSSELAPSLVEAGVRVIDLAGDFRLSAVDYPGWYGFEHPAPQWLDKAVYGLPELFASQVRGAQLVANPGCYPTPVILGVAPLLSAGLVEPGPIRVDGKTGLSGAGRAADEATSFASTEDSVRPYRFPRHQHTPEMERGIEFASGVAVPVVFVPHLVPTVRGVLVTAYATLAQGTTTEGLTERLMETYARESFIRVLPPGGMVDSKRVRGTNVVELQAVADPRTGTAIVVGAVDNLVKGAAGQAIQNMNLMLDLDGAVGLPTLGVYP